MLDLAAARSIPRAAKPKPVRRKRARSPAPRRSQRRRRI
ncbi:unnamed protein product [Penicillium roqueforti FM164]|uniref:Uncharacterized protein n=1 Tax=Penicillium roqueforti (strain FM164) TaxID=1365484 RepID=W6R8S0_PENRF|nr:unnamed protein product [Penicillium roqueforti FM164]